VHYFLVQYTLETRGVHATVLAVATDKRMTGLLVSVPMRPIPIPTDTGEYRPIPDTGIGLTIEECINFEFELGKTTESNRHPNPTTNPNPILYLVAVRYGSLALNFILSLLCKY